MSGIEGGISFTTDLISEVRTGLISAIDNRRCHTICILAFWSTIAFWSKIDGDPLIVQKTSISAIIDEAI